MFRMGARICANRRASFTWRGLTEAIYAVALIASVLPFRSYIVPRAGAMVLSLVHCACARACNSSACNTCKSNRRAASTRYNTKNAIIAIAIRLRISGPVAINRLALLLCCPRKLPCRANLYGCASASCVVSPGSWMNSARSWSSCGYTMPNFCASCSILPTWERFSMLTCSMYLRDCRL